MMDQGAAGTLSATAHDRIEDDLERTESRTFDLHVSPVFTYEHLVSGHLIGFDYQNQELVFTTSIRNLEHSTCQKLGDDILENAAQLN